MLLNPRFTVESSKKIRRYVTMKHFWMLSIRKMVSNMDVNTLGRVHDGGMCGGCNIRLLSRLVDGSVDVAIVAALRRGRLRRPAPRRTWLYAVTSHSHAPHYVQVQCWLLISTYLSTTTHPPQQVHQATRNTTRTYIDSLKTDKKEIKRCTEFEGYNVTSKF